MDLKYIKKYYGEAMMHLCRELFPGILEEEGKLFSIIDRFFDHNKELYDDLVTNDLIDDFKAFIYSDVDEERNFREIEKTPFELMDEVGYTLYECKTEADIQKFKKYYVKGEELCTFRGDRLKKCLVFFAVKKDADKINRSDFLKPKREDRYGTSVISIQFSRGAINTLSIKNRYNHTVMNPDATFNNNLENINSGLTKAFQKAYDLRIHFNKVNFPLTNYKYTIDCDGKFYKYNIETRGIYFCHNNIVIDNGRVKKLDKSRYIIAEQYIIDLKKKKIDRYSGTISFDKPNIDSFQKSIGQVQKIEVKKINNNLKKVIINDDIIIELNGNNAITGYINNKVTTINKDFLEDNEELKYIEMKNVVKIKDNFLQWNEKLEELIIPKVEHIGNCCLCYTDKLKVLDLPNVKTIGDSFLRNASNVKRIILPSTTIVGISFIESTEDIEEFDMPNIKIVGDNFLRSSKKLPKYDFLNLKYAGDNFLENDNSDNEILYMPNLKIVFNSFFRNNTNFKWIILPTLKETGRDFLLKLEDTHKIHLPNLRKIDSGFLFYNKYIYNFYAPKINHVANYSMSHILVNNQEVHDFVKKLVYKKD